MNLDFLITVLEGVASFRSGAFKSLNVKGSTLLLNYTDIDNNSKLYKLTFEEVEEREIEIE